MGAIQDKRFFSSAPKENPAAIPDKKERFHGAHTVGWLIEFIAILLFAGAAILSVWDGVRNDSGFLNSFVRFLAMLDRLEVYRYKSTIIMSKRTSIQMKRIDVLFGRLNSVSQQQKSLNYSLLLS